VTDAYQVRLSSRLVAFAREEGGTALKHYQPNGRYTISLLDSAELAALVANAAALERHGIQ
jgi:hypothetical protein